jgi:hypothetical protein
MKLDLINRIMDRLHSGHQQEPDIHHDAWYSSGPWAGQLMNASALPSDQYAVWAALMRLAGYDKGQWQAMGAPPGWVFPNPITQSAMAIWLTTGSVNGFPVASLLAIQPNPQGQQAP